MEHLKSNLKMRISDSLYHYTSLEIKYEMENRLAWYFMRGYPRPCFTPTLLAEILDWYHQLGQEHEPDDIHYVVMASKVPGVFNLGGDLNLFEQLIANRDRNGLMDYAIACIKPLFEFHTGLGRNISTISLVQGDALGGGFEAALSGDVLIAEQSAKMGMPEILFNLFPGMGAYSFLSRKVGSALAEKMILSGNVYAAPDLFEMGIVDVLVADGEGEQAVYDYIKKEKRARNGYQAFRKVKRYCNPVSYEELKAITTLWVDAALQLSPKDLRTMERLVKRQSARIR